MLALVPALATCAGLLLGAPPSAPPGSHWLASDAVRELGVRLEATAGGGLDVGAAPRPEDGASPACVADLCQPAVSVPGMEPRYERPHRTDLVVSLLDRAQLEPFATIGWALVATGLRFDYTPRALERSSGGGGGWGSVFVRLRLRLDADNAPAIPHRRLAARVRTGA